MNKPLSVPARRDLRQRMIEDMNVRGFSAKTQHDYLRFVSRFAAFLGRSPDLATSEDIRRFQIERREAGMPAPAMNSRVAGLRFFFTTTLDRPDLSRKLLRVSYPRKLSMVLSPDEVARLLGATTCIKHRAALSVAYGTGLRVAEVAAKVGDIDSERMLIRVERGKGGRYRNAMLSPDNPAYAGAYVYGRRRQDPCRRRPGALRASTVAVPIESWPICLRNAFTGYISWEEFMANQKRLSDNLSRYEADRRGVARMGLPLLQGLVVCGRCGRSMGLRYSGQHANYPGYVCTADYTQSALPCCQEVRALLVDAEVERLLLEALKPDRIALAVAALAQVEEEVRQLERQWSMKKERARYEAERARRQYDAVDPDNRLVARSLERQWEEKLREVEATDQAYQSWRSEQILSLSDADREALLAMGEDLPKVWNAATTTAADCKQILRFLVRDVVLNQKREQGQIWIKIIWATGALSEHAMRAECPHL